MVMPEFTTASALLDHYRAVFARRPPPMQPVVVAPDPEPEPPPPPPPPPRPRPVPLSAAVMARQLCCEHFGIGVADFKGEGRWPGVVWPRHFFAYLCRELDLCSFPRMGALAGDRDHTTMLHGANKVAALVAKDDWVAAIAEKLMREIKAKREAS